MKLKVYLIFSNPKENERVRNFSPPPMPRLAMVPCII